MENKETMSHLGNIFPTRTSALIFVSYMVLFINQGILVTMTKNANNKFEYNTTTVVLLTECLKLVISVFLYAREKSLYSLPSELMASTRVLLLYFIPAILYCIYNNLTFVNLMYFDPTTYFLLMQFRVVVTGVVFQVLFKKQLSKKQWFSLILLTMGCIVKQLKPTSPSGGPSGFSIMENIFNFQIILVLVQVFCSCFAGVYNEYLLKGVGDNVHIMVQNMYMYIDSITCNLLLLIYKGEIVSVFSSSSLSSVFQPIVVMVMFNNSGCGIVTSVFLKNLNSILKTFAAALELVFTAILCWFIFGIPIDVYTVLSLVIVCYSIYLYSQNPVVNQPVAEEKQKINETV